MSAKILSLASYALALLIFEGMVHQLPALKSADREAANQEQMDTEESRELWETSQALFGEHRYEEAIELALQLHDAYPGNHIYLKHLARSYHRLDRPQEEAVYWEKYMEISPTRVSACDDLAKAYRELDQEDKAIEVYERCIELAPGRSAFKLGLGWILLRRHESERARDLGLAALVDSPDDVDALLLVGQAYRALHDPRTAKKYLLRGVELKDSYTDFHRVLASIFEHEGDDRKALYHARKVLERHPDDQRAAARVARLQKSDGR